MNSWAGCLSPGLSKARLPNLHPLKFSCVTGGSAACTQRSRSPSLETYHFSLTWHFQNIKKIVFKPPNSFSAFITSTFQNINAKADGIKRAAITDATPNALLETQQQRPERTQKFPRSPGFLSETKDGFISTWKSLAVQQMTTSRNLLALTLCSDSTEGSKMATIYIK